MDTSSTTPVEKPVFKEMVKYFTKDYGNPSSIHDEGVTARRALDSARRKIAGVIGAHSDEIIFTNGGTESDNLAILGLARALIESGKISGPGHIITTSIEHKAVLEPCRRLEEEGWKVTYLPVTKDGLVDLAEFKKVLRPETVLVSIMMANNEIGTIEPLEEMKKIIKDHKLKNKTVFPYFHTDACQAPRSLPIKVEKLGVDLLTANGSKIYGPKGIGFLYVKRLTPLQPIILGGGQERNLRSGTENIPSIVGLAKALEICEKGREKEVARLSKLRDYFIDEILKLIPETFVNGSRLERLHNNVNITFQNVNAELLLLELDRYSVACSTGSACSTQAKDESHVIMALGHDKAYADSTLRFSLDRATKKSDLDYVLKILPAIVKKIRSVRI